MIIRLKGGFLSSRDATHTDQMHAELQIQQKKKVTVLIFLQTQVRRSFAAEGDNSAGAVIELSDAAKKKMYIDGNRRFQALIL